MLGVLPCPTGTEGGPALRLRHQGERGRLTGRSGNSTMGRRRVSTRQRRLHTPKARITSIERLRTLIRGLATLGPAWAMSRRIHLPRLDRDHSGTRPMAMRRASVHQQRDGDQKRRRDQTRDPPHQPTRPHHSLLAPSPAHRVTGSLRVVAKVVPEPRRRQPRRSPTSLTSSDSAGPGMNPRSPWSHGDGRATSSGRSQGLVMVCGGVIVYVTLREALWPRDQPEASRRDVPDAKPAHRAEAEQVGGVAVRGASSARNHPFSERGIPATVERPARHMNGGDVGRADAHTGAVAGRHRSVGAAELGDRDA